MPSGSNLATKASVLVVNNDIPAKTVAEFIAYAKANPGKISVGSSGIGTSLHLSGELFSRSPASIWYMCRIAARRPVSPI